MYTAGFHDFSRPEEIINPIKIKSILGLSTWLIENYDSEDFLGNPQLNVRSIASSILENQIVYLRMAGAGRNYGVIYGHHTIIDKLTVRTLVDPFPFCS